MAWSHVVGPPKKRADPSRDASAHRCSAPPKGNASFPLPQSKYSETIYYRTIKFGIDGLVLEGVLCTSSFATLSHYAEQALRGERPGELTDPRPLLGRRTEQQSGMQRGGTPNTMHQPRQFIAVNGGGGTCGCAWAFPPETSLRSSRPDGGPGLCKEYYKQARWSARHSRMVRFSATLGTCTALLLILLAHSSATKRNDAAIVAAGTPMATQPMSVDEFVRVHKGRFVTGKTCAPFYVSGWNWWETIEAASGALELFGASLPPNTTGPAMIRELLDSAQGQGLNVFRAWAHPVSPPYALETAPGEYNEAIFRGLDYLLDEARKRGIRVLLALTDNWQATGGADQFVAWAGGDVHEQFFSDPQAKELFKAHVKVVLERVNSINGRAYRDDPTIFGWDLINEPRCYDCGGLLAEWVQEMAAFVKSIDPNHMLTVGEEGFYPAGVPQSDADPQGQQSWAFMEGQNFPVDHGFAEIDFTSIHLWVNNWEDATDEFARRWIAQHIADAYALKKPLLIEEFGAWGVGKFRAERDHWYQLVYNAVAEDALVGGATAGAMFWQWYAPGQLAPAEEGGSAGGLFGIFQTDSTWSLISNFTSIIQRLNERQRKLAATTDSWVAACRPFGADSLVSPVPNCTATLVRGLPGTGFEGPGCNVDIDECARGTSDCDENAACANVVGSFTCTCVAGFAGGGTLQSPCVPTPRLNQIGSAFDTAGKGQVSCSEGEDLVYPSDAPGWAPDPTGGLLRMSNFGETSPWKNGFGSRVPVTPLQCKIACSVTPRCDSFAYNPEQERCFLKAGASLDVCPKQETVCTSARGTPYSCGYWQTYFNVTALGGRPVVKMDLSALGPAPAPGELFGPDGQPTLVIQQPISRAVQAYESG